MTTDVFASFDEPAGEADRVDLAAPAATLVPNTFPSLPFNGLAIIGEVPGKDEVSLGKPFVGTAGRFLNAVLAKSNILRDACYIGNVCQTMPPSGTIDSLPWDGPEIQKGLADLNHDLEILKPNLTLCLGNAALHALKVGTEPPKIRKAQGKPRNVYPFPIGDWRGSLFTGTAGQKCMATYHPSACLRQYSWTPLLIFDICHAAEEARTKELVLPQRDIQVALNPDQIILRLQRIREYRSKVALDIEGGVNTWSCISVAISPSDAFIVPLSRLNGQPYWDDPRDEEEITIALVAMLTDPLVPKVLQNSLYDRFILQYAYSIIIRGVVDDTLLKHWEWNCEFEKSLGFMCSLWTKEPYYKHEIASTGQDDFYRYCCKDACTTFEINEKLESNLTAPQKEHYRLNLELLNPLLYLQNRGIYYNFDAAKKRSQELQDYVFPLQSKLDACALADGLDVGLPKPTCNQDLLSSIYTYTGTARDRTTPKKDFVDRGYYDIIQRISGGEPLTDELLGRATVMCKRSLNVKSPAFKRYLYTTLGLPVQLHPTTRQPTINKVALLRLIRKSNHPALKLAFKLIQIRTRISTLQIVPCDDGRMRWSTNIVGSETGRITTAKSMIWAYGKRVGHNMQGIPDSWDMEDEDDPLNTGMRDLLEADPGWYLYKADFRGADGWTIGAYLKKLGDPTMIDDLYAGVKPAHRVCWILRHGVASLRGKTRTEMKEMFKEIKKDDWDYYACKVGIWGICYTMGPRKLSEVIFVESEGNINLTEAQGVKFIDAVCSCYAIRRWHASVQRLINNGGYPIVLAASNGHIRKFWGRKQEILGEYLAHLPQEYTTHATKVAARCIWLDPTNVHSAWPHRKLEILHTVHDELVLHGRIEDHQENLLRIRSAFNNEQLIADSHITIPFDGSYGTNWAMDEASKVGPI